MHIYFLLQRYEPDPFSLHQTTDQECQTDECFLGGHVFIDKCKICGLDRIGKQTYIKCSYKVKRCFYWVHAKCYGFGSSKQGKISQLKFLCPRHRIESDENKVK